MDTPIDPPNYPHELRLDVNTRFRRNMIAIVAIAAALPFLIEPFTGQLHAHIVLGFVGVGFAVWYALQTRAWRLVLTDDAITRHGLRRNVTLTRSEIHGFRLHGSSFVLASRQGQLLRVPQAVSNEPVFRAWLKRLPDIDYTRDAATLLFPMFAPPEPIPYRAEWLQRYRRVDRLLMYPSLGLVLAVAAVPRPLFIVSALLLPILTVVLVATSQGCLGFGRSLDHVRANPFPMQLAIVMVLLFHSTRRYDLFDITRPCLLALALAVLLMLLLVLADRSLRGDVLTKAIGLVVCCMFSYAAVIESNALLDRNAKHIDPVTVLTKRTHGSGRGQSYYLTVSPWGPFSSAHEHEVNRTFHNQTNIGDEVRVETHPGALAIAWYALSP